MADTLLEVEGLETCYGLSQVLFGLSLSVRAGEMVALMGRNGMGKTTTIRSIMGLTPARAGVIRFGGQETRVLPSFRIAQLGIGLVPEGRQLFPDLTVEENLTVGGYAHPIARDRANRERVFHFFPRLHERSTQLAGSLSGGEQQMLAIGSALMAEPRLLLVDELSLGLMPKMVDLCLQTLLNLKREGVTILLVEQNTARALDVADQVIVLSSGAMVFQGTAAQAKSEHSLFAAFLGMPERMAT